MTAVEIPAPFTVAKLNAAVPERGKVSEKIANTEYLGVTLQVVAPHDGETNLHCHPGADAAWIVLSGSADFYGAASDIVIANLGVHESITIPRATPYCSRPPAMSPS